MALVQFSQSHASAGPSSEAQAQDSQLNPLLQTPTPATGNPVDGVVIQCGYWMAPQLCEQECSQACIVLQAQMEPYRLGLQAAMDKEKLWQSSGAFK